jgi:signal transduction histidine kinase/CheY-like chemotaxis protein
MTVRSSWQELLPFLERSNEPALVADPSAEIDSPRVVHANPAFRTRIGSGASVQDHALDSVLRFAVEPRPNGTRSAAGRTRASRTTSDRARAPFGERRSFQRQVRLPGDDAVEESWTFTPVLDEKRTPVFWIAHPTRANGSPRPAADALLAAIGEAAALVAQDGAILRCNDAFRHLLGDESCERSIHDLVDDYSCTVGGARSRLRRSDGSTLAIEWISRRVATDVDRACCLVLVRHVREEHPNDQRIAELEAEVRRLQAIESTARVTAGIAHDFNNMLLAILGNADLARLELRPNSRAATYLDHLTSTAQRAAELCRQVLSFSGRVGAGARPIALRDLVLDMQRMLAAVAGSRIQFHFDLPEHQPSVVADPVRMRQVLLNLVVNAADAILPRQGTIEIRTRTLEPEAGSRCVASSGRGVGTVRGGRAYVALEILDDGHGMDEQTSARVFDRFFTTKPDGHGVGLAAVADAVVEADGAIEFESRPGAGTRMCVLLPSSEHAAVHLPSVPAPSRRARRTGRVLVVDDEAAIRTVAVHLLGRRGYEVLTAADGAEALAQIAQPTELAACLLDVTMPDIDGIEVLRSLRELRPDLPVVLSTGIDRELLLERLPKKVERVALLEKPYRADDLYTALDQATGHGAGRRRGRAGEAGR